MTNKNVFLPCGQCRHWTPSRRTPQWGECELGGSSDGKPDHPETLAYAADLEGYSADLITHANFGCLQAEPHEGRT